MFAPAGAVNVAIALVVLASAAPVAAVQPATGPVSLDGVESVAELDGTLQSERAAIDDLMENMLAVDRLYAELGEAQFQRVVLRSRMDEYVSSQHSALDDLGREYLSMQREPDRLDRFEYGVERSTLALADLHNTTLREQRLVDEIRAEIGAENGTLSSLDTPLAGALAAQQASQLEGLAYVSEQLAIQEERIADARELQDERLEYVSHHREIWREMKTVERQRALALIEEEFDRTYDNETLRDSRLDRQRYVVGLLRAHHHARMETAVEFTALLWSLDDDLAALDDRPSADEVEELQARLDGRASAFGAVRTHLADESAVTGRLREELAVKDGLYEQRHALLDEQASLVDRLANQSWPGRQNATVRALHGRVDEERAILGELDEQVAAERRLVSELYDLDGGDAANGRLAAYVRVRDRIADLLESNLALQDRAIDRQTAALRSRERAVARLGWARGVQDRWRRLPALEGAVRLDDLDATVLSHRFADQQRAFDLLTEAREEASATFAGEQALLLGVVDALDRVETATPVPAASNATNATGATNLAAGPANSSADAGSAAASSNATAPAENATNESAAPAALTSPGDGASEAFAGLVVLVLLLASLVVVVRLLRSDWKRI